METGEVYQKYDKVKKVIKSCENEKQLRVAVKMFNIFLSKYGDKIDDHSLHILKELIGLMRIKCLGEEVNEETSNIGKEFRKAAAMSGQQELQKLTFEESNEDIIKERSKTL